MIVKIDGIPVYDAILETDKDGMRRISLVDRPAVSSDFVHLAENQRPQLFAVADEEKRLVRGVVARADYPIYRNDRQMGEYYIIFGADTIRAMAQKYLADGHQNAVDLDHDGNEVEGVEMVQWFLKDTAAGISPEGFEDIADGSLFAEFHVANDDVWAEIKAGTFKGFSLDGFFTLDPATDVDEVQRVVDALEAIGAYFSKISKNEKMKDTKIRRILAALTHILVECANTTTDRGVVYWDGDEDLKAGDKLYTQDEEGNRSAAADGDYVTSDGKTIRVADGVVTEIVDPEAEVAENGPAEQEFRSVATDNGELFWDGSEDLKAGDAVYGSEGEDRQPAADGEYRTEDGKVIVVADGVVAEIRDDAAEVAPEGEQAETEAARQFRTMRQRMEQSYDEKTRKIAEAIAAVRNDEFYILEAGDDFAVVCAWGEDYIDHFYRYAVSWEGDAASVADPVEVKPMFVPMDFVSPFEREDEPDARDAELAALRAEVERLKKEPRAKSAHEEFSLSGNAAKARTNLERIVLAK